MAIGIWCPKCRLNHSLDAEQCSKCGAVFGRKKKYRVEVYQGGGHKTKVVDNLTMAREQETILKNDMLRNEAGINKKKVPTLNGIWMKYLPWAKEHKKSWQDDELYYNRHLEPRFGAKKLNAISPMDIERMKIEMKKAINKNGKPYAAATIKHQVVIIRRLFNLARKWRLFDGANPVDHVQMPRLDNQRTEFLTVEQFQKLLEVIDSWPYPQTAGLVKFSLFTGLRRGEVFKLQWDEVDFEHSLVTLRDPKGTTSKTIPVSSEALEILRGLSVSSEFVFPGVNGGMRGKSSIRDTWKSMKAHAGIPDDFRWHGLRHSFASWLVSNGVDLAVVQKLMTHKHASTTQRYAHLMPGALRDAAAKSGDLFSSLAKHKATLRLADRLPVSQG
jgi:integrase